MLIALKFDFVKDFALLTLLLKYLKKKKLYFSHFKGKKIIIKTEAISESVRFFYVDRSE